ncbi:MBL fold metallo-hydrolase [Pedobacter mucosus]|uniref:MBL fold metallo-hydrolase n=1 Tax=Pedobacter mucosus TaxID=2895286 RepID=UPI001EE3C6EE|nr:MBL fold metallo-hydrolase [Pedobacter mucosus]UKT65306.1 MBL fold metallo-hydrolase [Pedobacter mucosus]
MIFIYIILALAVLVSIILNLPVFGKLPTGLRLTKIKNLPNYNNGAIQNNSATPMQPEGISFFTVLKAFLFEKYPNKIPNKVLPNVDPDLDGKPNSDNPEIIWFGHSSYLIKVNGLRILVDPIFSKTPSPFAFIGGKAFPGATFTCADKFKNIDILLITHDHYDHLDYLSILKIAPQAKKIVTSLGVGSHLEKWGVPFSKIEELCWLESITLFNDLEITAVSARHFAGRKFVRNQTLWSAFIIQTEKFKLFIGGDSGYDTHFAEIGENYGPFDIAILECGQYNAYWPYIHMYPEQTVQAAKDLNAKVLMPVHWGKFSLAMHDWDDPVKRVVAEAKKTNMPLVTPKLGETIILNKYMPTFNWWL